MFGVTHNGVTKQAVARFLTVNFRPDGTVSATLCGVSLEGDWEQRVYTAETSRAGQIITARGGSPAEVLGHLHAIIQEAILDRFDDERNSNEQPAT